MFWCFHGPSSKGKTNMFFVTFSVSVLSLCFPNKQFNLYFSKNLQGTNQTVSWKRNVNRIGVGLPSHHLAHNSHLGRQAFFHFDLLSLRRNSRHLGGFQTRGNGWKCQMVATVAFVFFGGGVELTCFWMFALASFSHSALSYLQWALVAFGVIDHERWRVRSIHPCFLASTLLDGCKIKLFWNVLMVCNDMTLQPTMETTIEQTPT